MTLYKSIRMEIFILTQASQIEWKRVFWGIVPELESDEPSNLVINVYITVMVCISCEIML